MHSDLPRAFRVARVPFELTKEPVHPGASHVPQFHVDRRGRPDEHRIGLWPGDRRALLDPMDADAARRLLVLRILEPAHVRNRAFERPERDACARALHGFHATGRRLVREDGYSWIIEERVPAEERRLLIGYDESRLTIAQIRWGSTVSEARAALKPNLVRDAETRHPGCALRQGPWFFIPSRPQDRRSVETGAIAVARGERIESPSFHPSICFTSASGHVVCEKAEIGEIVLVRGVVSHANFRTLHLPEWRRAVRHAAVVDLAWPGRQWVE